MMNGGMESMGLVSAGVSEAATDQFAWSLIPRHRNLRLYGTMLRLAVILTAAFPIWVDSARAEQSSAGERDKSTPAQAVVPVPLKLRPGDPHAHGITDRQLDRLRSILRKAVDDGTVPGVSLLLAHKGEVIFKEAFGNIAIDQKVQMASSSKPIGATLLMILADQGKLALDDPIEKYLPEFKGITIQGKPPAKLPTVRHLLCNMSGLPGDFLWSVVRNRLIENRSNSSNAGKDPKNEPGKPAAKEPDRERPGLFSRRNRSLAQSVRAIAKAGLATEPGAEFHYCTMGFNVAARIAEVAGGQPFEELMRTELLEPLGMNNTRYVPLGIGGLNSKATLKNGESRFIMAGGGLTSTLDDFAAFYQMHGSGGTYNGHRILSERAVTEMHTRQGKLELLMSGPYGTDYGLAFFLDRIDKKGHARAITHPGLFGTSPWLDKDRQLVGVFLVQSSFLRVMPLVRDVQAQVREMIPVLDTPERPLKSKEH